MDQILLFVLGGVALISTSLAVVLAMRQRPGAQVMPAPAATAGGTAGADNGGAPPMTPEDAQKVEQAKEAVKNIVKGVSLDVQGFLGEVKEYGEALDGHQRSIEGTNALDTLREVEHLIAAEVAKMQEANDAYRQQLDRANDKIRKQEEELAKLSVDAAHDHLTRIGNRRSFDKRLLEELARFQRHGQLFSVILLDIDHFKKVNDEYGHVAGDRILRAVAGLLNEEKRTADFLARYGGEEFAMILPETKLAKAAYVADKARKKLENAVLNYEGQPIKVTTSAGVAEVSEGDKEPSPLLKRVDEALYLAKKGGRNQVISAQA